MLFRPISPQAVVITDLFGQTSKNISFSGDQNPFQAFSGFFFLCREIQETPALRTLR